MIVTIDKTHELKGNGYLLGVDGENGSEQLIIKIENETLLDKWVFIEFEKDNGEKFTTERLSVVGGQIVYDIANGLLPQGHVKVQVIFRDASGFVWKTFVRQFAVDKSLNASDNLPIEYPDFIGEAQKLLDEINIQADKVDGVLESEEARKTAETARETAETERTKNETAREEAEELRAKAESARQANEETRQANETSRVDAETARRTEFAGWSESMGSLNTYDKRLINLEEAGVGVLFDYQADNSTAYSKAVPAKSLPYAVLKNVDGAVSRVISKGRNLCCINENKTVTHSGVTAVSKKGLSHFTLDGTAEKEQSFSFRNVCTLGAGTYMLSVEGLNTIKQGDTDRLFLVNAENENLIVNYIMDGKPKTFTLSETTNISMYCVCGETSTYESKEVKVMLQHGTTATAYEPYKANTYTVPLTDNYIKVEPNGSVVFENDNGQAVPSEITFFVKK